jgi:hypothetical protein
METSPLKNGKLEQFHVGQYVSSFCADGESYRAKIIEVKCAVSWCPMSSLAQVHAGDRYLVTFVGCALRSLFFRCPASALLTIAPPLPAQMTILGRSGPQRFSPSTTRPRTGWSGAFLRRVPLS